MSSRWSIPLLSCVFGRRGSARSPPWALLLPGEGRGRAPATPTPPQSTACIWRVRNHAGWWWDADGSAASRGRGRPGSHQKVPGGCWLQIVPTVMELVGSSYRYHREEHAEHCVMVTGVPNVGKSSLINSLRRQHLRKGKATRVGGEPGITRAVMSRIQVCERPLMFLLDTPGVLAPRIPSVETGLKLALCGTVLDHLVGEETLADYLLYTLNRHQLLGYVQHYGLGEACDDIASVLKRVAVKLRKTQKVKVLTGTGNVNVIQPDYPAAARDFLRAFRSGLLGPVMLDCDLLQGRSTEEEEP
ncbi:mitochondrial ribosome-associated GTPase 1 isoform X2 [Capricornis sumatraensis]|uniref:mitochondrial ribosome-associated GTPase 1 isoform X2 n=1 Tax=Capricornis sumatraensis TaxID=34865 RepID=UPI0036047941